MTNQNMKLHAYASLGFVVVILDNVGSANRGLEFESRIQHRMGILEVQDQVAGLTHLIDQGIVDRSRILVTGSSYGGYMSLMCLAQRPDLFTIAVASAPVTQWEAYDTGYTERYMDQPKHNVEGYRESSVLNWVSGFPSVYVYTRKRTHEHKAHNY
jgi:dipeptidyl-peptidase 9